MKLRDNNSDVFCNIFQFSPTNLMKDFLNLHSNIGTYRINIDHSYNNSNYGKEVLLILRVSYNFF